MDSDFVWFGVSVATVVAAAVGVAYWDNERWDKFVKENNCKVVATVSDSVGTGFGMDAKGNPTVTTVYIPGKTGWQCSNGHTYYR